MMCTDYRIYFTIVIAQWDGFCQIQISLPSNTDAPTLAKMCTKETLWGGGKKKNSYSSYS